MTRQGLEWVRPTLHAYLQGAKKKVGIVVLLNFQRQHVARAVVLPAAREARNACLVDPVFADRCQVFVGDPLDNGEEVISGDERAGRTRLPGCHVESRAGILGADDEGVEDLGEVVLANLLLDDSHDKRGLIADKRLHILVRMVAQVRAKGQLGVILGADPPQALGRLKARLVGTCAV